MEILMIDDILDVLTGNYLSGGTRMYKVVEVDINGKRCYKGLCGGKEAAISVDDGIIVMEYH